MEAYKHLTIVNLAQAKELSLRQQGLSLKRNFFSLKRDWKQRVLRVLAQAIPNRLSEKPSLRRTLETKRGRVTAILA